MKRRSLQSNPFVISVRSMTHSTSQASLGGYCTSLSDRTELAHLSDYYFYGFNSHCGPGKPNNQSPGMSMRVGVGFRSEVIETLLLRGECTMTNVSWKLRFDVSEGAVQTVAHATMTLPNTFSMAMLLRVPTKDTGRYPPNSM